jgi:hypothetical protein
MDFRAFEALVAASRCRGKGVPREEQLRPCRLCGSSQCYWRLDIESDRLTGAVSLVQDPEIGVVCMNRANVPHILAG